MTTTPTITILSGIRRAANMRGMSSPSDAIAESGFAGRQPAKLANGVQPIRGLGQKLNRSSGTSKIN